MKTAYILLLSLGVANARPQGFISDVKSFLGISDKTSSTARTLIPPATASASLTKGLNPTIKSTTDRPSRTDSTITTTTSSRPSRTTSSDTDSSTITSAPTTTSTEAPPITLPPSPIPTTPNSNTSQPSQSSSVPAGGIAVAVIMSLAILLAIAWLIFRYHPRVRAWWLAREEKKMQERSYRQAIDGPFNRGGSGVRSQALGTSRKSMVASFFAPRTVKLGNGQEIRRKPVNWGASSVQQPHPATAELPGSGIEKVALTNMAAPMARSGSQISYQSNSASGSNVSSPSVGYKELPALPPMPPIPPIPPVPASKQRDVHGILSRKSIYELA